MIYFTNNDRVRAVKWRDWKFHYAFQLEKGTELKPAMRLFNLRSDPKEESDVKDANPWVKGVTDKIVADFDASTRRFPNVKSGTPDQ